MRNLIRDVKDQGRPTGTGVSGHVMADDRKQTVTETASQHIRSRNRRMPAAGCCRAIGRLLPLPLAASAFIAYVLWPRWPDPVLRPTHRRCRSQLRASLSILPPAAMRVPVQRRPGEHERVDLAFLWPSLDPPDPASNSVVSPHIAPGAAAKSLERVFVTISAAGDTLPPSRAREGHLSALYEPASPIPGPERPLRFGIRGWHALPRRRSHLRCRDARQFSGAMQPQRRRTDTGDVPLQPTHSRRRRNRTLSARLAWRLAHRRGQNRALD